MKSPRAYINEYNQLYKACDKLYHTVAARAGISDCAFWILYIVQDTKGICKQADVCENVPMSRQTVNSALKKLEKDGYLTLTKIEGKKGKAIGLTGQGIRFVQRYILPVMEAEERICANFSEEEKETFMGLFHTLIDRLSHEIGNGGVIGSGSVQCGLIDGAGHMDSAFYTDENLDAVFDFIN